MFRYLTEYEFVEGKDATGEPVRGAEIRAKGSIKVIDCRTFARSEHQIHAVAAIIRETKICTLHSAAKPS